MHGNKLKDIQDFPNLTESLVIEESLREVENKQKDQNSYLLSKLQKTNYIDLIDAVLRVFIDQRNKLFRCWKILNRRFRDLNANFIQVTFYLQNIFDIDPYDPIVIFKFSTIFLYWL